MSDKPDGQRSQEIGLEPGFRLRFNRLLKELAGAAATVYGDRLVSLLVFGSVGRGRQRPDSDVDILLVAERLPDGRIPRVREFDRVEGLLEPVFRELRRTGVTTTLSPVIKTPDEVSQGSLLFLDMIDDALVLFDRDDFAKGFFDALAARLGKMGARRIVKGGSWYWVLKPDYREGEVFEI